jgi:hypothetical protein
MTISPERDPSKRRQASYLIEVIMPAAM